MFRCSIKIKKTLTIFLVVILLISISPKNVHAVDMAKGYTLPYPSVMPGNFSYKVHLFLSRVLGYWSFGNFAQFNYNLHQSDEFLVQAKTLFEYDQYLLAYSALLQSDMYFAKTSQDLQNASKEEKDISQSKGLLKLAATKHIEVLEYIEKETPTSFVWRPEKDTSSNLSIHKEINRAIEIRKNIL